MQAIAQQNSLTFIVHKKYFRLLFACIAFLLMLAMCAWLFSRAWREHDPIDFLFACVISGIMIVSSADYFYKLERLFRHPFALKADQAGVHHFLLPTIPWADIEKIEFIEEKFNNTVTKYLCMDLMRSAKPNVKEIKWWRVSGADVRMHAFRHAVLIPCPELRGDPRLIASSINRLKQNTLFVHL
jgi:hypothetical protein